MSDNEHALRTTLRNLVAKLRQIEQHPSFRSMADMARIHGHFYTGPNWKQELEDAEALLQRMAK